MITPALAKAYFETRYLVFLEDRELVLHVPGQSTGLASLLKEKSVHSGAFITACNPHSELCSTAWNANRQATLEAEVSRRWPMLHGEGTHPHNDWPAEASLLILGITLDEARALARRYHQLAFLFASRDGSTALMATNQAEQHLLVNPR